MSYRNAIVGGWCGLLPAIVLGATVLAAGEAAAQMPAAIAAPGESAVATFHAEGAQVYECKAGADGKLAWAFREPIAVLLLDGKSIGHHYAGPTWEHADGSKVTGKQLAVAPGAAGSIPLQLVQASPAMGEGAFTGGTGRAHVSAAKMGLVGLARALASEFAGQNIRANVVSPGSIDTRRDNPEWYRGHVPSAAGIPLGRQGHVDDIAATCLFLVSDDGGFITGQTIHVNGGTGYS